MNNQKVGMVTVNEKNSMFLIYNKRASLEELILTLSENEYPDLFKKINNDLSYIRIEYDNWWKKMQEKYNWKINENEHWIMNFDTCEVFNEEYNN